MFKDKTKELFEKWYNEFVVANLKNKDKYRDGFGEEAEWKILVLDLFYSKTFAEQQGVYLQFLREQGIEILNDKIGYDYWLRVQSNCILYATIVNNNYDTALKSSITKAGELLNERSGK